MALVKEDIPMDDIPFPTEEDYRGEEETTLIDKLVEKLIAENEASAILDHINVFARLSDTQFSKIKMKLKDHFKSKFRLPDFEALVKQARKESKKKLSSHNRPRVIVGGQLAETQHSALKELEKFNKKSPIIFVFDNKLATIHYGKKHQSSIALLTESKLKYIMSLSADYVQVRETKEDTVYINTYPPHDVVLSILEMDAKDYNFPILRGITEMPIIRVDGSICQKQGYDEQTELFYIPGDLIIPDIPQKPTESQVLASVKLIVEDWFGDIAFATEADRAIAVSSAITMVIRSVIDGYVPLFLLDAPKQGSGKTMMAQAIGILGTGKIVAVNSPVASDEEMKKQIITWLLDSPSIVIIDNVIHPIEFPALNSALTGDVVGGRLLSTNINIKAENRAVWFASGNNIRVGDDTARRCVKCRIDAKCEKPHLRTGFRIPGGMKGYFRWTLSHRAELVEAILILMRNWYAKGSPTPKLTPLGSFDDWSIIVGGILETAGIAGFLSNTHNEKETIDDVSAEWSAFFKAIYDVCESNPFTLNTLARKMIERQQTGELTLQADNLQETLPATLTKHLGNYQRSSGTDREFPSHMGNAFKAKKDQVYDGLRFESAGKDRTGKVQWKIVDTSQDKPKPPTPLDEIETTLSTLIKVCPNQPVCTARLEGKEQSYTAREILTMLRENLKTSDEENRDRLIKEAYAYMPAWKTLLTPKPEEF